MKTRSGFSLMEVMVSVALVGGFFALLMSITRQQARERKIVEVKTSLHLLQTRAQQAIKKFQTLQMDTFVNTNAQRLACFNARGVNCEIERIAFPAFAPAPPGSREAELNRMMNGGYTLMGAPCNAGAACPVRVTTTWDMKCQGASCTSIAFKNTVSVVAANVTNREDKSLVSSVGADLESEDVYFKTKQSGLVRSLASTCPVPTGVNVNTSVMGCSTAAPGNANELFDTDLGFNFANGDLRLLAGALTSGPTTAGPTTSGETTDGPTTAGPTTSGETTDGTTAGPDPCPACTQPVMTASGIECRPSVLCSTPGYVVRGCKCCNPTIPGGGDGWGAWSICTESCGDSGVQSRSCLYPKEDYCESTCSRGETQTQACNRFACCSPAGTIIGSGDPGGNLNKDEVKCGSNPSNTKSDGGSAGAHAECCSGTASFKNGSRATKCSDNCDWCDNGGYDYDGWDVVCD